VHSNDEYALHYEVRQLTLKAICANSENSVMGTSFSVSVKGGVLAGGIFTSSTSYNTLVIIHVLCKCTTHICFLANGSLRQHDLVTETSSRIFIANVNVSGHGCLGIGELLFAERRVNHAHYTTTLHTASFAVLEHRRTTRCRHSFVRGAVVFCALFRVISDRFALVWFELSLLDQIEDVIAAQPSQLHACPCTLTPLTVDCSAGDCAPKFNVMSLRRFFKRS